jgi:hypothetical protein
MQEQLCSMSLQVDRVYALLRAHMSPAASASNQPHQPSAASIPSSQSDDTTFQYPESQTISLSGSSIVMQQNASSPVSSPSIFLQQNNRLPYLQDQDGQQRKQLKRLIEDVAPRISTLNELFA